MAAFAARAYRPTSLLHSPTFWHAHYHLHRTPVRCTNTERDTCMPCSYTRTHTTFTQEKKPGHACFLCLVRLSGGCYLRWPLHTAAPEPLPLPRPFPPPPPRLLCLVAGWTVLLAHSQQAHTTYSAPAVTRGPLGPTPPSPASSYSSLLDRLPAFTVLTPHYRSGSATYNAASSRIYAHTHCTHATWVWARCCAAPNAGCSACTYTMGVASAILVGDIALNCGTPALFRRLLPPTTRAW